MFLSGCANITDAGLQRLEGLTKLRSLYLQDCTKITDAGLEHVKALGVFEALDLKGTSVTDAGVENLRQAVPPLRISR